MAVHNEVCVLWPPELNILVEQAAASKLGEYSGDRYSIGIMETDVSCAYVKHRVPALGFPHLFLKAPHWGMKI